MNWTTLKSAVVHAVGTPVPPVTEVIVTVTFETCVPAAPLPPFPEFVLVKPRSIGCGVAPG